MWKWSRFYFFSTAFVFAIKYVYVRQCVHLSLIGVELPRFSFKLFSSYFAVSLLSIRDLIWGAHEVKTMLARFVAHAETKGFLSRFESLYFYDSDENSHLHGGKIIRSHKWMQQMKKCVYHFVMDYLYKSKYFRLSHFKLIRWRTSQSFEFIINHSHKKWMRIFDSQDFCVTFILYT